MTSGSTALWLAPQPPEAVYVHAADDRRALRRRLGEFIHLGTATPVELARSCGLSARSVYRAGKLVLRGYLHGVVNSGGRITREYAIARGRSDLVVEWPRPARPLADRPLKQVIECKVVSEKKGLESTIGKGLEQTAWYMDRCGAEAGHLVVFDLRPNKSWEERVFRRDPEPGAPPITVWGL